MSTSDPLSLLSGVLKTQGNDVAALERLQNAVQDQPSNLVVLLQTLLPIFQTLKPALKTWVLDVLIENALSRAPLSPEHKTTLCLQSLDILANLMHDSDVHRKKIAIQCFTSAYPLLFKHCCAATSSNTWEKVNAAKNTALNLWTTSTTGVRVAATKLVQRIIQTQTRGNADPRMQSKAEPNLSMCSSRHPFLNAQTLEDEAKKLLEECIKLLYISTIPDLVSAVVNAFTTLVKARPALANSIFTSLVNWEPNSLSSTSSLQIKSVEKTFRIALAHLLRSGQSSQFTSQITEFLHKQNTRMLQAADEAKRKRDDEASRKRSRITDELNSVANLASTAANKRRKIDSAAAKETASQTFTIGSSQSADDMNPLASFDVTSLPIALVTELIIANLQVVTESALANAINEIRRHLPTDNAGKEAAALAKTGAYDPLADQGDDELRFDVEDDEDEAEASMPLESFELPLPEPISAATSNALLSQAMARLRGTGALLTSNLAGLACEWVTIVSRIVTKGFGAPNAAADLVRQAIFEYIGQDPLARSKTALLWLSEEWFLAKSQGGKPLDDSPYALWLEHIIESMLTTTAKTTEPKVTIPAFVLQVPHIPSGLFDRFAKVCATQEQLPVGYAILRELALWRPSYRRNAADTILALTTHQVKVTRNAAIITAKRWIGETEGLGDLTTSFALHLLSRLEKQADGEEKAEAEDDDADAMEMDDDDGPQMARVENAQVVGDLPVPKSEKQVTQHIELFLSLCAKTPDLLDNLFAAYANMLPGVQEHVRSLVSMLIKSMGARHAKILHLVDNAPAGSESLVERVAEILQIKLISSGDIA